MHHRERVLSTYFAESKAESNEAQEFVDAFRVNPDVSTPREWMTYIDILTGLYQGHEVETPADDLVVLEMVPLVQNSTFHGLNIARRYIPTYRSGSVMAYLKIKRDGHEPTRAAIIAGRNPDDDLVVKKVLRRDNTRFICPNIKYPVIFATDIDTALKQSGLPIEIYNASV